MYEIPHSGFSLSTYQKEAIVTAIYPKEAAITYPLIGLIGEVGEFANKYKKTIRDGSEFTSDDMAGELGDILWYLACLADDCDLDLGTIAARNIAKLRDRQSRGVLGGGGDNR